MDRTINCGYTAILLDWGFEESNLKNLAPPVKNPPEIIAQKIHIRGPRQSHHLEEVIRMEKHLKELRELREDYARKLHFFCRKTGISFKGHGSY